MATTFEEVEGDYRLLFDKSELGFSDAVTISGIDARQLRNGLERGSLRLGTKLRVGRWGFNLRDCFQLLVIAQLTSRTWTPVAAAAEVAARLAPHAERYVAEVHEAGTALRGGDRGAVKGVKEFIIYQATSGVEVVVHHRGSIDWGFYTLSGRKVDVQNWQLPHIRMPVLGIILQLFNGYQLALGDELPPGFDFANRAEAVADSIGVEEAEA